jgi:hypothetical protein
MAHSLKSTFNLFFTVRKAKTETDRPFRKGPDGAMGCGCTLKSRPAEDAEFPF